MATKFSARPRILPLSLLLQVGKSPKNKFVKKSPILPNGFSFVTLLGVDDISRTKKTCSKKMVFIDQYAFAPVTQTFCGVVSLTFADSTISRFPRNKIVTAIRYAIQKGAWYYQFHGH